MRGLGTRNVFQLMKTSLVPEIPVQDTQQESTRQFRLYTQDQQNQGGDQRSVCVFTDLPKPPGTAISKILPVRCIMEPKNKKH